MLWPSFEEKVKSGNTNPGLTGLAHHYIVIFHIKLR
jgi:hypothetical protein